MQAWDAVVVGAGVIGLSLGRRLRQEGLRVLVIDKGEPGREASYAAGGMIAHCDPHLPDALGPLAIASAAMYPEFARELQDESGESPDLRDQGTLAIVRRRTSGHLVKVFARSPRMRSRNLEPAMTLRAPAYFLPERSVDPRALCSALTKAAKNRGVDFVTGSAGHSSRGTGWPRGGRENKSFKLCRRGRRQLCWSVGLADTAAGITYPPRQRPDGLCGAWARRRG